MYKNHAIAPLIILMVLSVNALAQNEPFTRRTVVSGLNSAWEVAYGPNDSLWITENVSYLVKRVHIASGNSTTLLNLSSAKNFSMGDGGRWPQGGLMGMVLHPNLYSPDATVRGQKPWVYLAYVYNRPTGQTCSSNSGSSNPCNFLTRVVRYDYSGNSLINAVIILDNIPGSNDHNSGRLAMGADLKLYYSVGDLGAGQFNNSSRTNNAQTLDVMEGKVLRLNSESDGDSGLDAWVPNDNPFNNGLPITPRDYVYTLGHRNAQGLVSGTISGQSYIFSSEHGDKSDDELNLLERGTNLGWPRVGGYCDDNYNGMTLGGYSNVNEGNFCTSTTSNREPLKTFHTLSSSQISAQGSDYLTWATIAPSSIDFYSSNYIPGWRNSVLIPCLKSGRVFRVKINSTATGLETLSNSRDTASYFRGEGRFRDMAISPDGRKIYMACDASGQTSGPTGGFNGGGSAPPNAGSIQEFTYTGIVLAVDPNVVEGPGQRSRELRVYPNPFQNELKIKMAPEVQKPFTIRIFSNAGVLVRTQKSMSTEIAVNLTNLENGLYILQITDAYGKLYSSQKILKQ